jgi:hypothetical protein
MSATGIELFAGLFLALFFGAEIFKNTVGPFIIWRVQKPPAEIRFESLEESDFTPETVAALTAWDEPLQALGFRPVGLSKMLGNRVNTCFRLFWNPTLRKSATVICGRVSYLEFSQLYTDGSVLTVSNSPVQGAFPALDFKLYYRYPQMREAAPLAEIHEKLRAKFKPDAEALEIGEAGPLAKLERYIRRESDALVERGLVHEEIDAEGRRALTLRGAFAMTYRSIGPGKQIWARLTARRSAAALREA